MNVIFTGDVDLGIALASTIENGSVSQHPVFLAEEDDKANAVYNAPNASMFAWVPIPVDKLLPGLSAFSL